jgi:hypothetical protein
MNKLTDWFSKNTVKKTILLVLLIILATNFWHARYNRPDGVIAWDIKSYYAYLPAVFIYNDIELNFRQENIEKFGELIWPVTTPTGKKVIITTMGMSVLYSPFFAIAHGVAHITKWEPDGYSRPYRFALTFSALFYLWLGMVFLAKILRRFFKEPVVAFTILAITLGTNLYYYSTYEAPMTHSYNFVLITLFIWLTMRFWDAPSLKRILGCGALAGFITLIRPTNIIVLLIFFLWNIKSWSDFKERFTYFIHRFHWVLIMAAVFVLVWVPQFAYWYSVSGKIFYFTYGYRGAGFFFNNPQIFNILLSYKKGWLVYTPLMIFALAGIFMLPKKIPGLFIPIIIYKLLSIYILSSWWSWWFGGGFGLRAFVDSYGLLAIPFACVVDYGFKQKNWQKYAVTSILVILILFNQFQTRQYHHNAIHWWWMNKEAYWETFLKLKPTQRFWEVVTLPDYEAARKGIYRELRTKEAIEKEKRQDSNWKTKFSVESIVGWLAPKIASDNIYHERLSAKLKSAEIDGDTITASKQIAVEMIEKHGVNYWDEKMALDLLIEEMRGKKNLMKSIEEKAIKNNISIDSQLLKDARWLLEKEKRE